MNKYTVLYIINSSLLAVYHTANSAEHIWERVRNDPLVSCITEGHVVFSDIK
jgi:hypothetical protein